MCGANSKKAPRTECSKKMIKNSIVIIDYGLGNIYNLRKAFQKAGSDAVISDRKSDIINAAKIVLPGVGAFSAGMEGLWRKDLIDTIKDFKKSGRYIFGICLGMQMLMTQSEENGIHSGLDLIKGNVKRFSLPRERGFFKIPHYGWSAVTRPDVNNGVKENPWQHTVLSGIKNNSYFYFVHSYYVVPDDTAHVIGVTQYGHDTFTSAIKQENITACQFHPELSGETGIHLIRNFITKEG